MCIAVTFIINNLNKGEPVFKIHIGLILFSG